MAQEFKHLFTPLKIGPITVRNRLVCTAHMSLLAEDNVPGERFRRYHAERARGGIGLIVLEVSSVHPTSQTLSKTIRIYDDRIIPYYQKLQLTLKKSQT